MDKDVALHVEMTLFRASVEIANLIPFLKEHCDEEEYQYYLKSIGNIKAELYAKISRKILKEHPEIQAEIDRRIDKYGFLTSG